MSCNRVTFLLSCVNYYTYMWVWKPSAPVRNDGRWASADVDGPQSNARAHGIQKKTKKESSRNFFQNSKMPQTHAQRSRASIDRKNAKAVSFLLFFEYLRLFTLQFVSKFSHFNRVNCRFLSLIAQKADRKNWSPATRERKLKASRIAKEVHFHRGF